MGFGAGSGSGKDCWSSSPGRYLFSIPYGSGPCGAAVARGPIEVPFVFWTIKLAVYKAS